MLDLDDLIGPGVLDLVDSVLQGVAYHVGLMPYFMRGMLRTVADLIDDVAGLVRRVVR